MEQQGLSTYCGSVCGFLEWRGRRVEECGGKTWQVGDRRHCLITKTNAHNVTTHVCEHTKDDWWDSVLLLFCVYFRINRQRVGRESAVGIATRYVLDGAGIESRWEARFSTPVLTGPAAHPASYTTDTGFSLAGVKRQGRGAVHPPHLVLRLKKKYIYTSTPPLGLHDLF